MDPETLKAEYPEAAEALMREGARQERERIQAIEELEAPGHEDLVAELKYDPEATAESVSRAIVERQKEAREDRLEARRVEDDDEKRGG